MRCAYDHLALSALALSARLNRVWFGWREATWTGAAERVPFDRFFAEGGSSGDDRQAGALPRCEPAAQVHDLSSLCFEDARGESRPDPARAVRDDDPVGGQLTCALAHLLVRHMDRSGDVAHPPLGRLADVQEDRALRAAVQRRSRVDLLDARDIAVGRIRRRVATDIVVPDDGELGAEPLRLLGV